jgi:membrane protein implicated in regulation of membrane protease activity
MDAWMVWLIAAGLVVIFELFSGTFYLLMIALGLLAGALAALLFGSYALQFIVAAVVGVVATATLHKSKYGWRKNDSVTKNPNVNIDIGQAIHVADWQEQSTAVFTSRTSYRGAQWDVELHHSAPYAGNFVIEDVQGNRLILRPAQ